MDCTEIIIASVGALAAVAAAVAAIASWLAAQKNLELSHNIFELEKWRDLDRELKNLKQMIFEYPSFLNIKDSANYIKIMISGSNVSRDSLEYKIASQYFIFSFLNFEFIHKVYNFALNDKKLRGRAFKKYLENYFGLYYIDLETLIIHHSITWDDIISSDGSVLTGARVGNRSSYLKNREFVDFIESYIPKSGNEFYVILILDSTRSPDGLSKGFYWSKNNDITENDTEVAIFYNSKDADNMVATCKQFLYEKYSNRHYTTYLYKKILS